MLPWAAIVMASASRLVSRIRAMAGVDVEISITK